jgi:hypothetical protein
MNDRESKETTEQRANPEPFSLRLPGFIRDEEIGLGDVIKRATSAIGVKPCGGCEARAAALNRWLAFTGRKSQ